MQHLSDSATRARRLLPGLALCAALAGCAVTPTGGVASTAAPGPSGAAASPTSATDTPTSTSATPAAPSASPTPAVTPTIVDPGAYKTPSTGGVRLAPTASGALDGRVITLDPGHNSKWITSVNANQIKMYGIGWRPCQALGGTASDGKTLESGLTWALAQRAAEKMRAAGATVVLTRPDDNGTGPCNNERAEIANRNGSSMLFSLHIDGADAASARGFQVVYSERMMGGAGASAASHDLANLLATEIKKRSSVPASRSIAADLPVTARSGDLGVLNGVGSGAAVLAEFGFISNAEDFKFLSSAAGQDAMADALVAAAIADAASPSLAKLTPHATSSAMPAPVAPAPVAPAPVAPAPVAPAPTTP